MTIHQQRTHPRFVEGCDNCRWSSVVTSGVSKTNGVDRDYEKRFNAEIKAFRDATRQGVEPAGSTMPQIRAAMRESERTGVAHKSTA